MSNAKHISKIASLEPARVLRTWRITPQGLVETDAGMGAFLDKPKTNKHNVSGGNAELQYAAASMQGWRIDMEDAHVLQISMSDSPPFKNWAFFAVFDGHAGKIAADGAASKIVDELMKTTQFKDVTCKLEKNDGQLTDEMLKLLEDGIREGFLRLDEGMRTYLDTEMDRSGTTAVCAIVTPTHIILANLGDSRAVISFNDETCFGTEDHKPYLSKERERIVNAGGSVMIQRINGSLAVSRAFGDFEYKNTPDLDATRQLVSPEPDVYVVKRNTEKDEFLLLACDGIYDVMENAELCSFVRKRMQTQSNLEHLSNDVLDCCLSRGSRDNMTMIIVQFPSAPKMNEEKAKEEADWSGKVHTLLKEIIVEEMTRDTWSKEDEISTEWVLREMVKRNQELSEQHQELEFVKRGMIEKIVAEEKLKEAASSE